jgi:hypothetical protein
MRTLLAPVLLPVLALTPAIAKDKNKTTLPAYVLSAQTVLVIVDPDAGEPLDQPYANRNARANVEKALVQWGRFRLVNDGEKSDLIITVRTGNGKTVQPTMKGGGIDQRPGVSGDPDGTIHIGAHGGQPPVDPGAYPPGMPPPGTSPQGGPPPDGGPRVSNEVGPSEDMLAVFRGDTEHSLDGPAAWRYIAKDCLSEPKVAAVDEFRKAIADAEKAKQNKKP